MYLINTATLELELFDDVYHAPRYAILSHRWGKDEVSYKEFHKGRENKDGDGYRKIVECCHFAQTRKQEWVWIDTCCVDKRSSAELSECLNSMWEWYSRSSECYAYLADVARLPDRKEEIEGFAKSVWFTRGWTLQELLAPQYVLFLSKEWDILGYKGPTRGGKKPESDGPLLNETVSTVTRIPPRVLSNPGFAHATSIAQRMSWMASRSTLRLEDNAYCLLGLFDVNMPMLYGEGWKAFERLQREILARYSDESIFAWVPDHAYAKSGPLTGMLAPIPRLFAQSDSIVVSQHHDRPPTTMTNRGLEIKLQSFRTNPKAHVYMHEKDPKWMYLFINSTGSDHMPLRRTDLDVFVVVLVRSACGHYNRVSSNARIRAPRGGWKPFDGDQVIYVHLMGICPERLNTELPPLPPEAEVSEAATQ